MRRNLMAERARLNLTQGELAARVGISQSHLSKIENGTTSVRGDVLLALAAALNLDPAAALENDDTAAIPRVRRPAREAA